MDTYSWPRWLCGLFPWPFHLVITVPKPVLSWFPWQSRPRPWTGRVLYYYHPVGPPLHKSPLCLDNHNGISAPLTSVPAQTSRPEFFEKSGYSPFLVHGYHSNWMQDSWGGDQKVVYHTYLLWHYRSFLVEIWPSLQPMDSVCERT